MVLIAALVVVVLGGLTALGLSLSRSTKVIADGPQRISLHVPRTWSDYTEDEPDQAADPAEQDVEVPDLDAGSFSGDLWLTAYVDPVGSDDLPETHRLALDDVCVQWTCADRGTLQPVVVDGQRGLEQVVTHPADDEDGAAVTVVLTVQSPTLIVGVTADRQSYADDPPSPEPLLTILRTLTVAH